MRLFILNALLGFPVALVFAWVFEVTPDGVTLDPCKQGSKRFFAAAMVRVVLALGWYFGTQTSFRRAAAPALASANVSVPIVADQGSIAVLPFVTRARIRSRNTFRTACPRSS